ncbi:MAG TPA: phage tail protein [Pyrinomonadaceae bacterium]|nr:phage tail protein [Pyrinomonadaceae bacterium]
MARVDPYKNFRFVIEIDGIQQAGFSECTGLGSRIAVIEYREGGEPVRIRKLAGRISYNDITLRWGITNSRELYDWYRAGLTGQVDRRTVSIVVLDEAGNPVARWVASEAWPSKWDGPALNALGNAVAIESLTLTCEEIDRA